MALQNLNLLGFSKLKELPTCIGQLTALQELTMWQCFKLKELPTSIGQLIALQKLNLLGCFEMKELPPSIDQLTSCNSCICFSVSNWKSYLHLSTNWWF